MICNCYDVVVVPFPFVDRAKTKRRPALVISNQSFNKAKHTILAMITTKSQPPWPGDSTIADFKTAGLKLPCIIRLKLFTLDNRFILRRIGRLAHNDAKNIDKEISDYLKCLQAEC